VATLASRDGVFLRLRRKLDAWGQQETFREE